MITCTTCGTETDDHEKQRRKCRPCRRKVQAASNRKLRAERREALIDPQVHDYGKGKLPPGFSQRGQSQLVDKDGNVLMRWIKSSRDASPAMLEEFTEAIRDVFEPLKCAVAKIPKPKHRCEKGLMNMLPIGDMHVGLLTWWRECGESFDLKLAEQYLCTAVDLALATAPKSETLAIINVGDYFHTDGGGNTTTKGTPVDVDGRWAKVLRRGITMLRYAVERGLQTHPKVRLYNVAGNHDAEATIALTIALEMAFEGNPRVTVETSPAKFHYLRHGNSLIGITHGDTCKPDKLPMVMACDRATEWGECDTKHWYTGHVHHKSKVELEEAGVTVETLRILAPGDAWHTGQGYRSGRDIKIDTWSNVDGLIETHRIGIRAIKREGKK